MAQGEVLAGTPLRQRTEDSWLPDDSDAKEELGLAA